MKKPDGGVIVLVSKGIDELQPERVESVGNHLFRCFPTDPLSLVAGQHFKPDFSGFALYGKIQQTNGSNQGVPARFGNDPIYRTIADLLNKCFSVLQRSGRLPVDIPIDLRIGTEQEYLLRITVRYPAKR